MYFVKTRDLFDLKIILICFSALPSHDPDEINKDIESVKTWIDKKKDEL